MNNKIFEANENCCCNLIPLISHETCYDPRFWTSVILARGRSVHIWCCAQWSFLCSGSLCVCLDTGKIRGNIGCQPRCRNSCWGHVKKNKKKKTHNRKQRHMASQSKPNSLVCTFICLCFCAFLSRILSCDSWAVLWLFLNSIHIHTELRYVTRLSCLSTPSSPRSVSPAAFRALRFGEWGCL